MAHFNVCSNKYYLALFSFVYLVKLQFFIFSMKTASKELQKLRSMAEKSLNKTAELQQVLAQIEATLSRAEFQKVIEKQNTK